MAQTQLQKDERSLGDLFSELAAETGTLVRQEVALAQVEITEKATAVGKNVGYLAVGGGGSICGGPRDPGRGNSWTVDVHSGMGSCVGCRSRRRNRGVRNDLLRSIGAAENGAYARGNC